MMKTVNYFGQPATVPDYAKYIATDANGEAWWYTDKPDDAFNRWLAGGKNCGCVGNNPNIKNWRRSLREC